METHPGIFILIGIWLLPTVLILMSRPGGRPHGWLWVLAVILFSWLGWVWFSLAFADD